MRRREGGKGGRDVQTLGLGAKILCRRQCDNLKEAIGAEAEGARARVVQVGAGYTGRAMQAMPVGYLGVCLYSKSQESIEEF